MNAQYKELVVSRIKGAIAAAKAVDPTKHPGLKGQLREILVRDILRPFLPNDIGLGTGKIITYDGHESPEQDVVMYDRRILPPFLFEQRTGFFPVEGVLLSIEVKTELNADELRSAHQNAAAVAALRFCPGTGQSKSPIQYTPQPVCCGLFAFGTDLSAEGKTECARYDEIRRAEEPSLHFMCVVGRGHWMWVPTNKTWPPYPATADHAEVVCFIAEVLTRYARILPTRGTPSLMYYLLEDD